MKRLLAVTIVGLLLSGLAHAECPDADRKALEALDRSWAEAGRTGNRAMLDKIYADDFQDLAPGNRADRAAAIADTMETYEYDRAHPQDAAKNSYDHYVIHCTPDTATITHRLVISGMDSGKPWSQQRRSVHMLEKRGGAWQVVGNAGHPLDDAGELVYLEHDWNNADMRGDAAWFERNYAGDFSGVSSRTGKMSGKAEDIADLKAGKYKMTWAQLSDLDARVEGDAAVVTGINHVRGTDDKGQAFDRRVRFTDTFIKRDGEWRVWASQGTQIQDK
ncbi:MAG: nuclear transport factor 2 family protein [Lysobacter sp.]|nr:nuclear transport factor 2 family protein [Lysobacter sp.]